MSGALTRTPGATPLTEGQARTLTDEIRKDAWSLWIRLLRAFESDRVACEFTPLLDEPDKLRQAHVEVVRTAPRDADGKSKVTPSHARGVVGRCRLKQKCPSPTSSRDRSGPARALAIHPRPEFENHPAPGLNDAVIEMIGFDVIHNDAAQIRAGEIEHNSQRIPAA